MGENLVAIYDACYLVLRPHEVHVIEIIRDHNLIFEYDPRKDASLA